MPGIRTLLSFMKPAANGRTQPDLTLYADCLREMVEPFLYNAGVDIVFHGVSLPDTILPPHVDFVYMPHCRLYSFANFPQPAVVTLRRLVWLPYEAEALGRADSD